MTDKGKTKRIPVPNKTRALLQKEVNSKCPFCKSEDVSHFEVHHIDGFKNNNGLVNLILVCPTCHSKIEKGDISTAQVKITKSLFAKTKHEFTAIELAEIENQKAIISRSRLDYLNSNEARDDLFQEKNKLFQTLQNKCDYIIKKTPNFGLEYKTTKDGFLDVYLRHIYISLQFYPNPFFNFDKEHDEYHISCTFNEREGLRFQNPRYKFKIYRYSYDINNFKEKGWIGSGKFKTSEEVAEELLTDLIKTSSNY